VLGLVDDRGVDQIGRQLPDLREVVFPALPQRIPAALAANLRALGSRGMLGGENPRHLADRLFHRNLGLYQGASRRPAGSLRITTR
jgi:hypothetical protein